MSDSPLVILCVHGVGHGDFDPQLQPTWTETISSAIHKWSPGVAVDCQFLSYDDLFAAAPLDAATVAEALAKLSYSGVVHGLEDLFGLSRDFGGFTDTLRWTAGMVAQWANDEKLRALARVRLLEKINELRPTAIVAHSLGSLICYDTFGRAESAAAIKGRTFVTLGSQIGNPFVRDALGGRIVALPAEHWFHLYNLHDKAFAAQIRISSPNFQQVPTPFDIDFLDHDAVHYLAHPNADLSAWRAVAGVEAGRALQKTAKAFTRALEKPARRALLIGINEYPDPANRLEGCVNDVFRMSEVLQECGFKAEEIRVVLNERATADGMRERLEWLLDGTEDGQDRVLFYSGHGAQIPEYGEKQEVDHLDECLVPYDFDWSLEHAITDTYFHELYSQLPYGTNFLAMFDCCHSGGMTRDGGPKVRGLTPPDDIRHRLLRWNMERKMWEERPLCPENEDARGWKTKGVEFVGNTGATKRLGRAIDLRSLPDKQYDRTRVAFNHRGPFLPVIIEACMESQLSYEYRHGVTSFGAFTYTITQIFRDLCQRGKPANWKQLVNAASKQLAAMRYNQTPVLVGPEKVISQKLPWIRSGKS